MIAAKYFLPLVGSILLGSAALAGRRSAKNESTCPLSNSTPILLDFAARAQGLNHDLRTPIGTIATAVELLRNGGSMTDDDTQTLQVLDRQVARLTAIAESLRELADAASCASEQGASGAR